MRIALIAALIVPVGSCSVIVDTEALGNYPATAVIGAPVANCGVDVHFTLNSESKVCLVECAPVDVYFYADDSIAPEYTHWTFEAAWLTVNLPMSTIGDPTVKLTAAACSSQELKLGNLGDGLQSEKKFEAALGEILGADVQGQPITFTSEEGFSYTTTLVAKLGVGQDKSDTRDVPVRVTIYPGLDAARCPDAPPVCE